MFILFYRYYCILCLVSRLRTMNASCEFVKKKFEEYYERDYNSVLAPKNIEKREFGFLTFDGKNMLRHIGFHATNTLESFLRQGAYSDAYYSCAYYENPEAEMDKKGWLGADLVFDIDADHIPTPCNKIHDEWICDKCSFAGKGVTPDNCPICGGQRFSVKTWPCTICLDSAKAETVNLLDMLLHDFGFSDNDVRVFFSGHRGYHVHVEGEAVKDLDAMARKEIVDYVTVLGLDVSFHGLSEDKRTGGVLGDFDLQQDGWRGKIAKGIYDFIANAKEEDFRNLGLKSNVFEALQKSKEPVLKSLKDSGTLSTVKGMGFETWRKIAQHGIERFSSKIDTVVTTDIHRLIRLMDTLHGKTGLKKVEFPIANIEDFDPFKEAVAFKGGRVTVVVSDAPEFRVGDETFGPYKKQKVELSTAAAVLLICKNRAEVVEQNV